MTRVDSYKGSEDEHHYRNGKEDARTDSVYICAQMMTQPSNANKQNCLDNSYTH